MGQSASSLTRRAKRVDPTGNAARHRDVQGLFDDLSHALTTGDGDRIARMWETPALVLGDGMARAIESLDEVRAFFRTARQQYDDRGVTDTRAELVRVEWLTPQIAMVEVHWPHIDAQGTEIGGERSTYTLRRDEHGKLKIRAVVMQGEDTPHAATA